MGRFRFGPVARMMVVDTPPNGYTSPVVEVGTIREAIDGTRTKDVTGHKQEFKIALDGLDARALSWFEMAYRGALGPDLYMLDEERVNRLSAAASTARSAWAAANPFTASVGTLTTAASANLLLPGTLDGVAVSTPGPTSTQTWITLAAGTLTIGGMYPVQLAEHVVFSAYVPTGTPTLELVPLNAAGAPLAAVTGTVVVASSPPRRHVAYTVPAGVVAVRPVLRHAGASTSIITALQLEQGDTPSPWVMGVGVPRVVVVSPGLTRRRLGRYMDTDISLLEV